VLPRGQFSPPLGAVMVAWAARMVLQASTVNAKIVARFMFFSFYGFRFLNRLLCGEISFARRRFHFL
jgi:hypothetical protein